MGFQYLTIQKKRKYLPRDLRLLQYFSQRRQFLLRSIWHSAVRPELLQRRYEPERDSRYIVAGLVHLPLTQPQDASALLRESRVVRTIQRAGHISDGVAFANIVSDGQRGWRLRVAVLGFSDIDVGGHDPQPRSSRFAIAWRCSANRKGLPQLGARTLRSILDYAFVRFPDEPAVQLKRVQPLGSWRKFIQQRPQKWPPRVDWKPTVAIVSAVRDPSEQQVHEVAEVIRETFIECARLRRGEPYTPSPESNRTFCRAAELCLHNSLDPVQHVAALFTEIGPQPRRLLGPRARDRTRKHVDSAEERARRSLRAHVASLRGLARTTPQGRLPTYIAEDDEFPAAFKRCFLVQLGSPLAARFRSAAEREAKLDPAMARLLAELPQMMADATRAGSRAARRASA